MQMQHVSFTDKRKLKYFNDLLQDDAATAVVVLHTIIVSDYLNCDC